MRVMLKIQTPVEAGNKAIKEGIMQKNIQRTLEELKPEAAYFIAEDGVRTSLWFIDLKDPSQLPVICEPFFQGSQARVTITPAMNPEDLMKGLQQASQKF